MKFKGILWLIVAILLLYSVPAEYYVDITATDIDEATFNVDNFSIHRLSYNTWRLNSTETGEGLVRSKLLNLLYSNIFDITNPIKIEVSNSTDIGKGGISAYSYTVATSFAGPRTYENFVRINFTNATNLSVWTSTFTQSFNTPNPGTRAYSRINETNILTSSCGSTCTDSDTTYNTITIAYDSPYNATLLAGYYDTSADNDAGTARVKALYFGATDTEYSVDSCGSNIDHTCTSNVTDYYNDYSVPRFSLNDIIVSFYQYAPLNNSDINSSRNLSYTLYNVDTSADCSIYVNDTLKETVTGQGNGSNSIYYNVSYGTQGLNEVNITCTDASSTYSDIKYIFVDSVTPSINSIKYYNGTGYSNLSGVTTDQLPFNLRINVSDDNLYSFNLSIIGEDDSYSYYNNSIPTEYIYNETILLETDNYNLTVIITDLYNNSVINTYSKSVNFTYIRYNYTIYLVDEQTGDPFNVELIDSAILYDDEDGVIYDFTATNTSSYNFIGEATGKRRIELLYSTGDVVNRYIELNITGLNATICANYENVTHYEQFILSSRERRVKMISQFADCYVAADYTRFAYGQSYVLKAYTTDRPYTLRIWTDNVETDLAGIDGGISTEIYLDVLEFAKQGYEINILSDTLNFEKREEFNNTIYIQYFNLRDDLVSADVTITNLDDDSVVYSSSAFDNPNEFNIAFDYSILPVNDTTLFKIVVDKVDEDGLESSITRYFNTQTKTGIINSKFAIVLAVMFLLFGLTFTTVNIALSWFGIIIDLLVIVILSLSITSWYIVFLMGLTFIFLIYKIIIMTQKNITTIA